MGSMGILIAITCIANYISGMILAREKYDTLKMIVPRFIVFSGVLGTVYLLHDKDKSFAYSFVIALFVQIIIMIVDVASSNLAILITREDINFLLYKNGYNIVIYNSIIRF